MNSAPEPQISLGNLAVQFARRFNSDLFERLAAAGFQGLRPRHSALLMSIDQPGTRVTTLADRAEVTVQSMGELVDDLERAGYVERHPDPADRRARLIRFTDRGRTAVDVCMEVLADIEQEYRTALGRDRYAATWTALNGLLDPTKATSSADRPVGTASS